MAPVLIREITRRINCKGIFQAAYTGGLVLSKPIASCRYWHRPLNIKKLVEVNFSHLGPKMTMQKQIKLMKLPQITSTLGIRPLTEADVTSACQLLNGYLRKYKLATEFNPEEFAHWFMPRKNVIDTFVVENAGQITDMISFYTLPTKVLSHDTYNK